MKRSMGLGDMVTKIVLDDSMRLVGQMLSLMSVALPRRLLLALLRAALVLPLGR